MYLVLSFKRLKVRMCTSACSLDTRKALHVMINSSSVSSWCFMRAHKFMKTFSNCHMQIVVDTA